MGAAEQAPADAGAGMGAIQVKKVKSKAKTKAWPLTFSRQFVDGALMGKVPGVGGGGKGAWRNFGAAKEVERVWESLSPIHSGGDGGDGGDGGNDDGGRPRKRQRGQTGKGVLVGDGEDEKKKKGIDLLGDTVFTHFVALNSGLMTASQGECSLNCGGTCPACLAMAAENEEGEGEGNT